MGTAFGRSDVRTFGSSPLSLYLHIPFCLSRCNYCDFNTYLLDPALCAAYLEALGREIAAWTRAPEVAGRPVETLFVGGGTPSLLAPAALATLLERCRRGFPVASEAEVTLEANPGTVDGAKLRGYRAAGVNRLSFGVQSFEDRLLRAIGRLHSAGDVGRAVGRAREAGFDNLNLDLMFGLPGQTAADWDRTLDRALALGPEHLSVYGLTLEEGTQMTALVRAGRVSLPGEEAEAAMYERTLARLAAAGYEQYEVSNFARPGRRCRHNLRYWEGGDYLGLGAGSHSHLDGRRFHNHLQPRHYAAEVAARGTAIAGEERLEPSARVGEAFMLGLRLRDGVDLAALEARYGAAPVRARAPALAAFDAAGLVERRGSRVRLTERGLLVANEVLAAVL